MTCSHQFSHVKDAVLMLVSRNLHKKNSEVSIKTKSTLASLSFKGQVTKHATLKWSIPQKWNLTKLFVGANQNLNDNMRQYSLPFCGSYLIYNTGTAKKFTLLRNGLSSIVSSTVSCLSFIEHCF